MTKKIIKSFRDIVLPHMAKELLRIDYEGMGQDDAKEFSEHFNEILDLATKALEQQPCENEYIKVPKKALKYRTAGMVAYNAEWLKNHFDIERTVICGTQEPITTTNNSDVLDKIRTEIEHLTITEGGEDYIRKMAELYSLKIKVLQIIDKYR